MNSPHPIFLVYGRALIQFKSAHHTKPVHLKIKPVLSMCCAPYEFYHSPPASALTRTNPSYSFWQSSYLLLCPPGESSQPKPIRKLLKIAIGRPCPSNVSSCMKSPTPAPWSIYLLWLLPLQPGITSYLLSMPVPMRYQMHNVESKYNLAHFSLKLINYACTSLIMYKPDTQLVVPYHSKGSCQVSTPAGKYFFWKSQRWIFWPKMLIFSKAANPR